MQSNELLKLAAARIVIQKEASLGSLINAALVASTIGGAGYGFTKLFPNIWGHMRGSLANNINKWLGMIPNDVPMVNRALTHYPASTRIPYETHP